MAVIKADQMIDLALKGLLLPGLAIRYRDLPPTRARQGALPLCSSDTGCPRRCGLGETPHDGRPGMDTQVVRDGGLCPKHRSWIAWGVGVAGLMFAALLQLFLLAVTGKTA